MKYPNIREEELKNKVAQDYFWLYDCSKIIGNVDFSVCLHQSQKELFKQESLLWAEAKKGSFDIYKSIVQLILTIGKARTFDKFLPPAMLGAFDGEKIAFIPYNDIHEVFYINDFNWNVTPSNHDTKEFKLIHDKVKSDIDKKALIFNFISDDRELNKFIKKNFIVGKFGLTNTRIDKNNFVVIYNKWLKDVKPTIAVNWDIAKKSGIIDGDFYLADLLSQENNTLKEKLFVLLKHDHYELDRKLSDSGFFSHSETSFNDKQVAHTQFWNKYDRPPKEEYWDYIVERRDLLVPQDVRERKGSFFTPQIWVELSQKYLTDVLGEDWQDEYYVWDCAAGTGNLLTGLTNKYNIWASTLDTQDVEVMHDRIKNGANLLDDHVFQFDFLNDEFTKLPKPLQAIINDPEKRKKLVVYINPPYAEHLDKKNTTSTGTNLNKAGIKFTKIDKKYNEKYGSKASRELFVQFFIRINEEISGSFLASFSKLKYINSSNFIQFRIQFNAKYQKGFMCPANTFDNVKGDFPIGFIIWKLDNRISFNNINLDIYNSIEKYEGQKLIHIPRGIRGSISMNDWIKKHEISYSKYFLGHLNCSSQDFLHQNYTGITICKQNSAYKQLPINEINLFEVAIYFSVTFCIEATWINDRDQFLFPNNNWKEDLDFKNDCLAFIIFHGQNRITHIEGINHWIPFTEQEVNAREKFESNFMSKFINGKLKVENAGDLFGTQTQRTVPLVFSPEATKVMDAGRELWKYYHQHPNANVNASLYDIREHFQGRNEAGKMNNRSSDEKYTALIGVLRENLRTLAGKIEPKVYEYGFLKT